MKQERQPAALELSIDRHERGIVERSPAGTAHESHSNYRRFLSEPVECFNRQLWKLQRQRKQNAKPIGMIARGLHDHLVSQLREFACGRSVLHKRAVKWDREHLHPDPPLLHLLQTTF